MAFRKTFLTALLLCVAAAHYCSAEQNYLESGHFVVSYPAEIAETARLCLEIAEETAEVLAPFFGYEFAGKKIVIDLHDESDFSNGFARFRQRYVRIDIRKTRILWRGETPWLRNVLAHELSHTYTVNVLKLPRYIWTEFGIDVDEEGVEGSGSCFIEHNRMPHWFLEGLSQVGAYKFGGDRPDPYREMLLRDSFFTGRLLSLDEMARFERSSRERELVYNQGFYFVLFMLESLPGAQMARFLHRVREVGLEAAVRQSFGATLADLHREWVASLADRFSSFAGRDDRLDESHQQRHLPLVLEVASTADGRYVIANWREDFRTYALFERRGRSDRAYRRIADDVGTVLRQDPVSGTVWFNKLVYKPKEDYGQFELFRLDASGSPKQIMAGTRTRAFDVYDDKVVFASYDKGTTRIEQYDHRTSERRVLRELPPRTPVYSLTIVGGSTMLVTVGDGGRIRLFRLAADGQIELWPEVDADICNPIDAGGGRIAFSSTLDGTPQLYVASIDGAQAWQKLTDVPGGVLHPVGVDQGAGVVICSVYGNGSLRLKRVPLSDDGPGETVRLASRDDTPADDDHLLIGPETRKRIGQNLTARERKGAVVLASPTWILEYHMDDDEFDDKRTYVHAVTLGTALYLNNASDTMDLQAVGGIDLYVGKGEMLNPHPFLGLYLDVGLSPGTFNQNFDLYGFSYYAYDDPDQYAIQRRTALRSETEYWLPVSFYTGLLVGYSYLHEFMNLTYYLKKEGFVYTESGEPSIEVEEGSYFARHDIYLLVERSKAKSTYDPARLGVGGSLAQLQLSGIMVQYHNEDYFGVYASDNPATALEISARVRARVLLARRKLSVTSQLRGFGYLQTEIPDPAPAFLYRSLGRVGYATGYDYFYPAYYYGQMEIDIRINPFHNPYDAVRWYERFSLGIRGEGGMVFTVDGGELKTGYPITVELALRGGILVSPVREASWYCRVAFPLYDKDFFGTEWDYRIYFGFSL